MKIDAEKLLKCIGQVGDDLIAESETATPRTVRKNSYAGAWLSAAAVFVLGLVLVGVYFLRPGVRRAEDGAAPNQVVMFSTGVAPDAGDARAAAPGSGYSPETEAMYGGNDLDWHGGVFGWRDGTDDGDSPVWEAQPENEEVRLGRPAGEAAADAPVPSFPVVPLHPVATPFSEAVAPPVRLLDPEELTADNQRFVRFDMSQLPTFRQFNHVGERQLVLTTDDSLRDVSIVQLNHHFVFGNAFYYIADETLLLDEWQPNVLLLLDNYDWWGHVPWFALSYRGETPDERQYVTVTHNFASGCVPQTGTLHLDNRSILPPGGYVTDHAPLYALETAPPSIITALLGDFTPGEIHSAYFWEETDEPHFFYYRLLHYDRRENFAIRSEPSPRGYRQEMAYTSEAARALAHEQEGIRYRFGWGVEWLPTHFTTQERDAVFLYAPYLNATWLFIDVADAPVPWETPPNMRTFASVFRP